jgi:hypothetical protein
MLTSYADDSKQRGYRQVYLDATAALHNVMDASQRKEFIDQWAGRLSDYASDQGANQKDIISDDVRDFLLARHGDDVINVPFGPGRKIFGKTAKVRDLLAKKPAAKKPADASTKGPPQTVDRAISIMRRMGDNISGDKEVADYFAGVPDTESDAEWRFGGGRFKLWKEFGKFRISAQDYTNDDEQKFAERVNAVLNGEATVDSLPEGGKYWKEKPAETPKKPAAYKPGTAGNKNTFVLPGTHTASVEQNSPKQHCVLGCATVMRAYGAFPRPPAVLRPFGIEASERRQASRGVLSRPSMVATSDCSKRGFGRGHRLRHRHGTRIAPQPSESRRGFFSGNDR